MEIKIGRHYLILKRIGAGSFGEIYLGEDTHNGDPVAIKLEPLRTRAPQLFYESKLYFILSGGISIPRIFWYGSESNYNIMVIELLGESLEDLFKACDRKFSLKTVLMLVDQMLAALEFIHIKSFIHRDIKPDNFMIGRGSASGQIYAIDFGLSKKYRDPRTFEHIPFATGKSLTGTARYASVNALNGFEQSRRDDLEAVGYVWMYFLRGSLPWQGLDPKGKKEKYEMIRDVKSATSFEELCSGYPVEFVNYFNMVRSLEFSAAPSYSTYRAMFKDLFIREGYVYDYQYDWVLLGAGRPPREHKTSDASPLADSSMALNNRPSVGVEQLQMTPEQEKPVVTRPLRQPQPLTKKKAPSQPIAVPAAAPQVEAKRVQMPTWMSQRSAFGGKQNK